MRKSRLAFMMVTALLAVPACGGGGEPTPQSQIVVDKTSLSIYVGLEETLTATYPEGETVRWTTSDESIATVEAGVVHAVAVGQCVITVQIMGTTDKATCNVTVLEPEGDFVIKTPTEIRVETTFNDNYGAVFTDAVARLKAKEPYLTVTYSKYQGNYDMLREEIIKGIPANNYPDIAAQYPDGVADFITAGVALDMEPYMYDEDYGWTDDEFDDFYSAYLDEGSHYSISGTLSLPIAKSTEAMYYDADKIEGLVLPGVNNGNAINEAYLNNLTWEELFDVFCPALLRYRETLGTEDAKKAFLDTETESAWALVGYDSDDNLFITLAEQYGYGYTSLNELSGSGVIEFENQGMKDLMKKFYDAKQNKYFTTKGVVGKNVNYLTNADQMLFAIGSTGGVSYQFDKANPKHVKAVRIPHAGSTGGNNHIIQQGPSLAFLDHNDENRAIGSWLFYKELTQTKSMVAWSTITGYSPIRESVAYDDDYIKFMDETRFAEKTLDHLKALNAQYVFDVSDDLFFSPVFKGSSEARKQVGGLTTEILKLDLTGDALITKINELFHTAYENAILKI